MKRAWASLQEVEEEVSKMMAEVDKNVQEAVSVRMTTIWCIHVLVGMFIQVTRSW